MGFLDETDSLRAKLGLGRTKIPLVIGMGILVLLCVIMLASFLFVSFTTPEIKVEESETTAVQTAEEAVPASIYVHVTGAVKKPGLYELKQGARLQSAIESAGGFTDDALEESVNLAREVTDGEQVVVASTQDETPVASGGTAGASSSSTAGTGTGSAASASGKVNLNRASAEELMALEGVGQATAAKIIAYREEHGSFKSIEEIKNVSGIGDKKYAAIKDSLTV